MKPLSDEPIRASTPGLDAMAARQNEPIRASTPGLDAMEAKPDVPLLERKRAEEEAKKAAAADKADSDRSRAQANRDARKLQRGLRRAEITGRVNQFVRDWASRNAAVTEAVNAQGQSIRVAELPNIGTLNVDTGKLVEGPVFAAPPTSKSEFSSSMPNGVNLGDTLYWDEEEKGWKVLAAPASSAIHVLAIAGSAPYWIATENC